MTHPYRRHTLASAPAALLGAFALAAAGCDGNRDEEAPAGRQAETAPPSAAERQAEHREQITPGTFRPGVETPAQTGEEQGRLPAEGDLAAFVPSTELFPGEGRLDPAIDNPLSGDPAAIAAGERHFEAFNCGGCHAPLGGGGMGPPLSDDVWIHGGEPAQIYQSIMHGRPEGMPAWSSMLPRRTAWEIVAYIESLADIEDYAAEKGFESRPPTGGEPAGDQGGADESTTGQ